MAARPQGSGQTVGAALECVGGMGRSNSESKQVEVGNFDLLRLSNGCFWSVGYASGVTAEVTGGLWEVGRSTALMFRLSVMTQLLR